MRSKLLRCLATLREIPQICILKKDLLAQKCSNTPFCFNHSVWEYMFLVAPAYQLFEVEQELDYEGEGEGHYGKNQTLIPRLLLRLTECQFYWKSYYYHVPSEKQARWLSEESHFSILRGHCLLFFIFLDPLKTRNQS